MAYVFRILIRLADSFVLCAILSSKPFFNLYACSTDDKWFWLNNRFDESWSHQIGPKYGKAFWKTGALERNQVSYADYEYPVLNQGSIRPKITESYRSVRCLLHMHLWNQACIRERLFSACGIRLSHDNVLHIMTAQHKTYLLCC
jgi:hypothetical protein